MKGIKKDKKFTTTVIDPTQLTEDSKKKSIFYKTSALVFIYGFVLILTMLLQSFMNIANVLVEKEFINGDSFLLSLMLSNGSELPLSTMAFLWASIASAYVGTDRAAYAAKSFSLSYGEQDVGDPSTVRFIIAETFLVYLVGVVLNMFTPGEYCLNELASAFGTTILFYVAGQKAGKIGKYRDGGHKVEDLESITVSSDDYSSKHNKEDTFGDDFPSAR